MSKIGSHLNVLGVIHISFMNWDVYPTALLSLALETNREATDGHVAVTLTTINPHLGLLLAQSALCYRPVIGNPRSGDMTN